jgi:hypothetical protein
LKEITKEERQPIFFPVAGRVTSESLYRRLRLKRSSVGEKKYSLIIQFYEIEESSVNIVNDFLRQLAIFRIYDYATDVCCLSEETRIYLEIQDERMMEKIPFLKFLITDVNDVIKKIERFAVDKIEYSLDNVKLGYVLIHLSSYANNQLDTTALPHPSTYKHSQLVPNHITLIQKYF